MFDEIGGMSTLLRNGIFRYSIPSSLWFHTASRRQIVYLLHLIEYIAVPARERRYEEPSAARGGTEPRQQGNRA